MNTIRLLLLVCVFGLIGCEDTHHDDCHCDYYDDDDYDRYYYTDDYVYYDYYICPNCGGYYYY
jgi:hypothetical protein